MHRLIPRAIGTVLCLAFLVAQAALPPPSPQQLANTAASKAAADARAKLDQQALLAAMDVIAARWRANARTHGWPVNEAVPVPAPTAALKAPADNKPPAPAPATKGKP